MTFQDLLDGAEVLSQSGDASVQSVEYDSRRIIPGSVFVAMRGEVSDGNQYIDQAIQRGAVAVVTDSATQSPRAGVAWAQVPHGRRALGRISSNFYHHPTQFLSITGITGTNGKTTTSFLLESIFKAAGRTALLLGTIEYHVCGQVFPSPHTTPESLELQGYFHDSLVCESSEAVMEVSSHALAQDRVYSVPFDVGVFTNLTRDHLDYHGDMETYFAAKRILFEGAGAEPPRLAVINSDDAWGVKLAEVSRKRQSEVCTYGLDSGNFRASNCEISATGLRFDVSTPYGKFEIASALTGRVNIFNILAASAAAFGRGCSVQAIADGVRNLAHVPGRFQVVSAGQPFTVVVDYAHTDDALKNLIAVARDLVTQSGRGRVITLFGCGGDRDQAKRPLMGKAAAQGSDLVFVTSDNPRSEDPAAIIEDIVPGLKDSGVKFIVEPDRAQAINLAIAAAQPGDILLLAGKGHEKTQTSQGAVLPFDDVKIARGALHSAGFDRQVPSGQGQPAGNAEAAIAQPHRDGEGA